MKRLLIVLGTWTVLASVATGRLDADGPQLAHMVFFTLSEDTDDARNALVGACQKYLSGHEGTVHFSVGSRVKELDREVNDKKFDVALHLVFASKAAHDAYQTHPRHLKFVEDNKHLWSGVRVFDSLLAESGQGKGSKGSAQD